MKQKILVIYDDLQVCRIIRGLLQVHCDLDIITSLSIQKALHSFLNQLYDLVIMDILFPDVDGFAALSTMRNAKTTPILVLSVDAGPEAKARAMQLGADTCISVPFSSDEFLAQVQALLRRSAELGISGPGRTLSFDMGLIIDPQYHSVSMLGRPLPLTRKEFDILYFLVKCPFQIRTKEQIYAYAWHADSSYGIEGLVKYHISNLRRKIDPNGAGYIESVRGIGYRFRPNAGSDFL